MNNTTGDPPPHLFPQKTNDYFGDFTTAPISIPPNPISSFYKIEENATIWVTFEKEGVHRYPAALTDSKLADVFFLGYPHRHLFKFRVEIQVFHDDRDVEFILFKRELQNLYEGNLQLDYKSCEMIARELLTYIIDKYPNRTVTVSVSEDGENGSVITRKVTPV